MNTILLITVQDTPVKRTSHQRFAGLYTSQEAFLAVTCDVITSVNTLTHNFATTNYFLLDHHSSQCDVKFQEKWNVYKNLNPCKSRNQMFNIND